MQWLHFQLTNGDGLQLTDKSPKDVFQNHLRSAADDFGLMRDKIAATSIYFSFLQRQLLLNNFVETHEIVDLSLDLI